MNTLKRRNEIIENIKKIEILRAGYFSVGKGSKKIGKLKGVMQFLITASQIPPAPTLHALIKKERSFSGHLIKPEVSRNDYLDQHLFGIEEA